MKKNNNKSANAEEALTLSRLYEVSEEIQRYCSPEERREEIMRLYKKATRIYKAIEDYCVFQMSIL